MVCVTVFFVALRGVGALRVSRRALGCVASSALPLLVPSKAPARAEWHFPAESTRLLRAFKNELTVDSTSLDTGGIGPEWRCRSCSALDSGEWKVSKRQQSSVRIRPETMLSATDARGREIKVIKVPLGRGAASSSVRPQYRLRILR